MGFFGKKVVIQSAREHYIEKNPDARIAKEHNAPKAVSKREQKQKIESAKATMQTCQAKAEAKGKKGCVKKGASYIACRKHNAESKIIAAGYTT